MSILTLLTDALLAAVLVWLLRGGALGHARDLWWRRTAADPHSGEPAVRVHLENVDRIVVVHRSTARRWDDVRPGREVIVLDAGEDALRVCRAPDGSIVLEAERDVAIVGESTIASIAQWRGGAPDWAAAPLGRSARADGGRPR